MCIPLDPRISEFETQEQADSYDRWFRERIQQSFDDPRPNVPHDEAMARVRTLIESKTEFATQEQADSYDCWFRERVQRSLDNPGQGMPHDQVMAEVDAIIDAAEQRQNGDQGHEDRWKR